MKFLIFDAGPIISMAMSGMLPVIEKLKEVFPGEFILTPHVKNEVIDRPMKIKQYKLEAIQVKDMLDRGVFKMSNEFIPQNKLDKEVKRLLKLTGGVLRTTQTGEKINLIQDGEAACLAFAKLCNCDSVIVIDERTTRMLTEAPKNLEKMMEKKLKTPLDAQLSLLDELKDFKFIRSSELLFVAWKKNMILPVRECVPSKIGKNVLSLPVKNSKELLDALLYGVKFKGCAISSKEIEDMKKLV